MSHIPLAVEKKEECHNLNFKFLIWLSWHRRRRVFVLTVSFWIILDTTYTVEHLLFLSHTSYPKHPRNSYFWLLKKPESTPWPRSPLIIHSLPMWIKSDFTCLERPFTADCQWDGIHNTLLILWLTNGVLLWNRGQIYSTKLGNVSESKLWQFFFTISCRHFQSLGSSEGSRSASELPRYGKYQILSQCVYTGLRRRSLGTKEIGMT